MDERFQYQPEVTCSIGFRQYTIQPGDTFYLIAVRNGTSVQALLNANPGVNPNQLMVGQVICIPAAVTPITPIHTPCCALLQPVIANLPSTVEIPIGGVLARSVAMSTRAFTVTVAPLPEPAVLGNFNAYLSILNLFRDGNPQEPETAIVRLVPSSFGAQPVVWAGSIISIGRPATGETVEVRPFNSFTGSQGRILLSGDLGKCLN